MLDNPSHNFTLKNSLFDTVKSTRSRIKNRFIYNCQLITFDGTDPWSHGNYFAQNVINFGVDKSSSFHTDNQKMNFLELDEGSTDDINDIVGIV